MWKAMAGTSRLEVSILGATFAKPACYFVGIKLGAVEVSSLTSLCDVKQLECPRTTAVCSLSCHSHLSSVCTPTYD